MEGQSRAKKTGMIVGGIALIAAAAGLIVWGAMKLVKKHIPFTLSDKTAHLTGSAKADGERGFIMDAGSAISFAIPADTPDKGGEGQVEFDYVPSWNGTGTVGGQAIFAVGAESDQTASNIYIYFHGLDKWEAHIAGDIVNVPQIDVRTVAGKKYHVKMSWKNYQWTISIDNVVMATAALPPTRPPASRIMAYGGAKAAFYNVSFSSTSS